MLYVKTMYSEGYHLFEPRTWLATCMHCSPESCLTKNYYSYRFYFNKMITGLITHVGVKGLFYSIMLDFTQ